MRCVFIIMGDDVWFGGQQTDGALWRATTEHYWCRCHDWGILSLYVALMSIGHFVFCVIVAWEWHMFGSCHHLLLIPNFLPRLWICGRRDLCWCSLLRPGPVAGEMFTFTWHQAKEYIDGLNIASSRYNIGSLDLMIIGILHLSCQVWLLKFCFSLDPGQRDCDVFSSLSRMTHVWHVTGLCPGARH